MPVEKAIIFRWAPDAGEGYFTRKSLDCIRELAEDMDAIVCGPGIGRNSSAFYLLEYLNSIEAPVVYDADALNLVAMRPEVFQRQGVSVLTPHPGEMKRLLKGFKLSNYLKADRTKQAVKLAEKTGAIVVLKGHQSVIADPKGRIAINSSGSPALSTAGSGDVLSGITGAFLAQGDDDDFKAVCAAVFIHGLAGELSGYGMRGTIADDLPRLIPEAMKRISPFT
jgi:NAD(P)H-hydrate epimerase